MFKNVFIKIILFFVEKKNIFWVVFHWPMEDDLVIFSWAKSEAPSSILRFVTGEGVVGEMLFWESDYNS